MNSVLKKILYKFIIPVILLYFIYSFNYQAGLIAMLLYLLFLFFSGRSTLYIYTGAIKFSKGNTEQAALWYRRAYKTGKMDPRQTTSYSFILLKAGRIEESEDVLNKLLSSKLKKDDEMYAKSNLALVQWKKGNLDGAIATLEESISNIKNSAIYGSLGYFYLLKGDLDNALQLNLEAYDYNDSDAIILDNLGQTYYLMGEYKKSLEIYEKLMIKKPSFPEAYYNYGLVLLNFNRYGEALEMMEKALSYKLSFLSTITRETIETKLTEIKDKYSIEANDKSTYLADVDNTDQINKKNTDDQSYK